MPYSGPYCRNVMGATPEFGARTLKLGAHRHRWSVAALKARGLAGLEPAWDERQGFHERDGIDRTIDNAGCPRGCGCVCGVDLVLGAGAALAQQKKAAPKAAAPAAAAPAAAAAAPANEQQMWVKLCEKAPVMTKDKDGKDVRAEKDICLTHHERLDGNTGMVLVSAAIRQVEGQDKQHLMVMVPLGMAIQPGLRATVYNKELWEKAQKNEKVDDAKLSPVKLKFSLCHPAGCTAEIELTKEIMDQLQEPTPA